MYKIRVSYGVQSTEKVSDTPLTIRQVRNDYNLRAELGYGDNTRALIAGVEMPDDAQVPNGGHVVLETRANQKAN